MSNQGGPGGDERKLGQALVALFLCGSVISAAVVDVRYAPPPNIDISNITPKGPTSNIEGVEHIQAKMQERLKDFVNNSYHPNNGNNLPRSHVAILAKFLEQQLSAAVADNIPEEAEWAIEQGAPLNVENEGGWTHLGVAAYAGHIKMAQLLIEKGANVNVANTRKSARLLDEIQDGSGWGPLLLAAKSGSVDIVELIVKKGVEINNVKNSNGDTALHIAAPKGSVDLVEYLLQKGANPNIKNKKNETAWDIAQRNGNFEVTKLLESHGYTPPPLAQVTVPKPPSPPAPAEIEGTSSLARTFRVTGEDCNIRGETLFVTADKDISTLSIPNTCSLIPV